MANEPVMGSAAHPVRLDPYQRIIEVGWGGRFAVLEITAPEGISFLFGHYDLTGSLGGTFTKDAVINAVMQISLDNPVLGNLYDTTQVYYLIGTVVFPDRVPPDPFAYDTIKASIHAPNRFVEPTDLRTLSSNEFPYQIEGWPTDGNWGDPAFPWGHWADGRPAYLPASSGADPSAPGYYINPNWGLGEAYRESRFRRDFVKYAFLLDFRTGPDRIGNGVVDLSIAFPGTDDHLSGGYTMQIVLKMYGTSTVFAVSGATVATKRPPPPGGLPVPPIVTQSRSAAYDQHGVIARINKAGFVS